MLLFQAIVRPRRYFIHVLLIEHLMLRTTILKTVSYHNMNKHSINLLNLKHLLYALLS